MGTRISFVSTLIAPFVSAASAQKWTPPRTPLGDPDLQGAERSQGSRRRTMTYAREL